MVVSLDTFPGGLCRVGLDDGNSDNGANSDHLELELGLSVTKLDELHFGLDILFHCVALA